MAGQIVVVADSKSRTRNNYAYILRPFVCSYCVCECVRFFLMCICPKNPSDFHCVYARARARFCRCRRVLCVREHDAMYMCVRVCCLQLGVRTRCAKTIIPPTTTATDWRAFMSVCTVSRTYTHTSDGMFHTQNDAQTE